MNTMTATSGTTILSEPTQTKLTPYSGMNDLLLPASPFKVNPVYEGYRFQPLVYIGGKSQKPETFTYIFVEPSLPAKHADFSKTVKHWYAQEQKENNVKFKLIEQSGASVADVPAKYLVIESKGYGNKLREKRNYRHHIYLLQTGTKSFSTIRLSRLKENDKTDSELWQQWPNFINSIKNTEPDSSGLTTKGQSDNARRYYAHNLNFDLPLGDSREVGKWINQNAADRKDIWLTKKGNITLNISLIDDYDFSVKKENADYLQEAEAMESGGAAYFEKLTGNSDLEYEKIEIPFGKSNIFYGYIEKSETHSELTLKAAYKTGRAIEIEFEAKNEVFEEHKEEIVEWVKNIIVLP